MVYLCLGEWVMLLLWRTQGPQGGYTGAKGLDIGALTVFFIPHSLIIFFLSPELTWTSLWGEWYHVRSTHSSQPSVLSILFFFGTWESPVERFLSKKLQQRGRSCSGRNALELFGVDMDPLQQAPTRKVFLAPEHLWSWWFKNFDKNIYEFQKIKKNPAVANGVSTNE